MNTESGITKTMKKLVNFDEKERVRKLPCKWNTNLEMTVLLIPIFYEFLVLNLIGERRIGMASCSNDNK